MRYAVCGVVTVTVLAGITGCGNGSPHGAVHASTSSVTSTLERACVDAVITIPRGRQIEFHACGANARASVTSGANVLSQLGSLVFVARASGTATVEIDEGAPCSPGMQCSQRRKHLAQVVVNVS